MAIKVYDRQWQCDMEIIRIIRQNCVYSWYRVVGYHNVNETVTIQIQMIESWDGNILADISQERKQLTPI